MPLCYIIGHKNPDTDAICSALAYADFKHRIGEPQFVAARCGNTNARIDAVLNRFGVHAPVLVGDVTPRVKDVMATRVHKARPFHTCAEALEVLEMYDIRVLPVVDDQNKLEGQVSIFRLGEFFVPHQVHSKELRHVHTSLADIRKVLKAQVHHLEASDKAETLYVRVGAVSVERFRQIYKEEAIPMDKSILVVGDRDDMIMAAIDMRVRLIVLTLGVQPSPQILSLAKERGVSLMTSSYDSANTAWMIRTANHLEELLERKLTTFSDDEIVSGMRKRLMSSRQNVYFVTDESKVLRGVFTKGDLYKPSQTNLILVDHNEVTQAVDGASEVEILEIIDHHRLGNLPTQKPIRFINEPVGSTCTIVADLFRKEGIAPAPSIAGLMMAGIITDTLNLQSPTATLKDATLLTWLASIAGQSIGQLAGDIFSQGSVLVSSSPKDALGVDQKTFSEGDEKFIIAQVEEVGFEQFWERYPALLQEVRHLRQEKSAAFVGLIVTNVTTQTSLFVVDAPKEILSHIQFNQPKPQVFDIGKMVSRKKEVVPYVSELLKGV